MSLKEECSIKKDTFIRFRDRFQFPKEIRVCLPRKGEKSCVFAHGELYFYDAAFLCGLRFPIYLFIMELLHYLNIAPGQLMPNSWRIVISCMVIWTIIADRDMITLNEIIHLYRLKESKEFDYYELLGIEGLGLSSTYLYLFVIGNLGISLCWVMVRSVTPASLKLNLSAYRVELMNYLIYFEGDIILYCDIYKENK